jgi:hypothetical protein
MSLNYIYILLLVAATYCVWSSSMAHHTFYPTLLCMIICLVTIAMASEPNMNVFVALCVPALIVASLSLGWSTTAPYYYHNEVILPQPTSPGSG